MFLNMEVHSYIPPLVFGSILHAKKKGFLKNEVEIIKTDGHNINL